MYTYYNTMPAPLCRHSFSSPSEDGQEVSCCESSSRLALSCSVSFLSMQLVVPLLSGPQLQRWVKMCMLECSARQYITLHPLRSSISKHQRGSSQALLHITKRECVSSLRASMLVR